MATSLQTALKVGKLWDIHITNFPKYGEILEFVLKILEKSLNNVLNKVLNKALNKGLNIALNKDLIKVLNKVLMIFEVRNAIY